MNMISKSVDESCNYGWFFGHFRELFIGKENQSIEWKSARFDASSYQRCFSLTTEVFDFKSPEKSGCKNVAQHKGYGKKTKGSSVEASICVFFPHAITSKILFWGSKMFWSADKFMLFCWDWLTQITQPVCKESLLLGRFFWSEVCWRLAILLIFPHDLGILYEI